MTNKERVSLGGPHFALTIKIDRKTWVVEPIPRPTFPLANFSVAEGEYCRQQCKKGALIVAYQEGGPGGPACLLVNPKLAIVEKMSKFTGLAGQLAEQEITDPLKKQYLLPFAGGPSLKIEITGRTKTGRPFQATLVSKIT